MNTITNKPRNYPVQQMGQPKRLLLYSISINTSKTSLPNALRKRESNLLNSYGRQLKSTHKVSPSEASLKQHKAFQDPSTRHRSIIPPLAQRLSCPVDHHQLNRFLKDWVR